MSGTDHDAVVFPGLAGATFADLGRFLALDQFARPLLRRARTVLGYPVLQRLHDSGEDDYSEAAQVASLISSLALAERALLTASPAYCAGPSFGVRATAVLSGCLSFEDGVRATVGMARQERAYFENEHTDLVTQTVVRVPDEKLTTLLGEWNARGERLELSGDLDQGFAMITLSETRLAQFRREIGALGGYNMHTMRPPAHSVLFGGLREAVAAEVLPALTFREPVLPVVTDQDGTVADTAQGVREMLLNTFDRPFSWPAVVASLTAHGVRTVHLAGADPLFHRLDSTKRHFRVVRVDPRSALRPTPALAGRT
ncbi:malonyl CoA-acyl carrier protein transacylase [Kineosporia sp. NBRC 101677]|uniref:hypothetical protein n=1 Tax=Kineosporia sp. NBRC 101677 TaxID=3032197 RepID=UPI0024A44F70|nr:hypothetical protein [Kineosporia sp. NBRC 101677]GLY16344.1 malonyl CoA-acyl carrier protein transacylase [Kineosporia sp. NBRC 101677]